MYQLTRALALFMKWAEETYYSIVYELWLDHISELEEIDEVSHSIVG